MTHFRTARWRSPSYITLLEFGITISSCRSRHIAYDQYMHRFAAYFQGGYGIKWKVCAFASGWSGDWANYLREPGEWTAAFYQLIHKERD